jgi:hypothetical protein
MGEFVVAWPGAPVGGEFSLVPMEWSKIIQLPTRGIRAKQNKLDQCLATDQSNIRVVLVLTTQTVVSFCPIRGEEGCFLYGVFNGFDGSRVSSFVSQCLTAELLLGQLKSTHTDVRRILSQVCVCVRDINCYVFESACMPGILSALGRMHSQKHHVRNAI